MPDRFRHNAMKTALATFAAALLAAPLFAAEGGGIAGELPEQASEFAPDVDFVFNVINILCIIFFVLIIACMAAFIVKYRRKKPTQTAESQTAHNTLVELSWTIPPLFIVLWIFWLGFTNYMQLTTPPPDAYTVRVSAQKWAWSFTHPNGRTDTALHVPAGEPVRLVMDSQDVIHSLYIPAFRVKKDVVPGRYSQLWFEANAATPDAEFPMPEELEGQRPLALEKLLVDTRNELEAAAAQSGEPMPTDAQIEAAANDALAALPDEEITAAAMAQVEAIKQAAGFQLFCTEFCGTQHSTMLAKVVVHEPGWRPAARTFPSDKAHGEFLFQVHACVTCHQVVPGGAPGAGPAFAGGLLGREENIRGLGAITVDEDYIRESIRNPAAKIVEPYQPVMPIFGPDKISDEEIDKIIVYLRSLSPADAQ